LRGYGPSILGTEELVTCRCPHGTPLEIEAHGLAPAGWKKPAAPETGARLPDCALCGNSGRTTIARLRVARNGAVLTGSGWVACAAGAGLGVAWLTGVLGALWSVLALLAGTFLLAFSAVTERRVAQTAPGSRT
jgi:hypothetical protein